MEYYPPSPYPPPYPPQQESHTFLWVVVVIVIIIVIIVGVWYFYYRTPSSDSSSGFTWNLIDSTGTSGSFDAKAGNAYVVKSGTTNSTVALNPPSSAAGQMFMIINGSSGTVTGTISGGSPVSISPNSSRFGVWMSQTELDLI